MTEIKDLVAKENLEQVIADAVELSSITQGIENTEMDTWDADLEDELTRARDYAEQIMNTIDSVINENNGNGE